MRPYEFALLRYVHDISTQEFANIGVILYDSENRVLSTRTSERYGRLSEFFGGIDGNKYRAMLRQVDRALTRVNEALREPDLLAPPANSLHELLAAAFPPDESSFQLSAVMYGVADEPITRRDELFEEFVSRYDSITMRPRRDESDVRREISERIIRAHLTNRVRFEYQIQAPNYDYTFQAGWKNGKPQVLEPISFDLVEGSRIVEKANSWSGRLLSLSKGADFAFTGVVAPPTDPTLQRSFDKALAILGGAPSVRQIVLENNVDRVVTQIRDDTDAEAAATLSS